MINIGMLASYFRDHWHLRGDMVNITLATFTFPRIFHSTQFQLSQPGCQVSFSKLPQLVASPVEKSTHDHHHIGLHWPEYKNIQKFDRNTQCRILKHRTGNCKLRAYHHHLFPKKKMVMVCSKVYLTLPLDCGMPKHTPELIQMLALANVDCQSILKSSN